MLAHGFKPIEEEWWQFTLANEPYPDAYFDFPVCEQDPAEKPRVPSGGSLLATS